MNKLQWMQDELLKAGNLKAKFDLKTIVDPKIHKLAADRLLQGGLR
jgi:hypothetical protein